MKSERPQKLQGEILFGTQENQDFLDTKNHFFIWSINYLAPNFILICAKHQFQDSPESLIYICSSPSYKTFYNLHASSQLFILLIKHNTINTSTNFVQLYDLGNGKIKIHVQYWCSIFKIYFFFSEFEFEVKKLSTRMLMESRSMKGLNKELNLSNSERQYFWHLWG